MEFVFKLGQLPTPHQNSFSGIEESLWTRYEQMVGNGFCLGAYDDNNLIAFALADITHWNSNLWIWEFHVAVERRGMHTGTLLLKELAQRARNASLRTIVVETQNTNVPAIRFYQSCGFTLKGFDLSYYSNNDWPDGEVALFMKYRLVSKEQKERSMENPIYNTILSRRSIRKFTSEHVTSQEINLILKAAMAAPSAVNSQPWEFIVISEIQILEAIQSILPYSHHNAPLGIIVCGSPLKANNPAGALFWVQDCSAAMENLLLTTHGLGLGGVWVGIHPVAHYVRGVRKALKIPSVVTPLGLALIGHPAEKKPARTQFKETRVHWQKYGLIKHSEQTDDNQA